MIAAIVLACLSPAVHDGDGLRCPGGRTMRLAGIDAPELAGSPRCRRRDPRISCDDTAARRSRDHLQRLVAGRSVRCTIVDASPFRAGFQPADRYGRPVVRCVAGGRDLSAAQLEARMAVRWPPPGRHKPA